LDSDEKPETSPGLHLQIGIITIMEIQKMSASIKDHLRNIATRATVIRRAMISLRDSSAGEARVELAALVDAHDDLAFAIGLAATHAEQAKEVEEVEGRQDAGPTPAFYDDTKIH